MKKTTGIILIAIACLCWLSIIIIPFLSLSLGLKAGAITVAIILGEVFFWLGTIFVGKQLFDKFKGHAVFGKRKKQDD